MNKTEYLSRTFSRMDGKKFESYVINAIWHRLNNLNLKPVTQQYVKTAGGKYYLLDLYFPQLNLAIEVDEPHHKIYINADSMRAENIISSFVKNDSTVEFKRILIYDTDGIRDIEDINKDIDILVADINGRIKNKALVWDIENELKNQITAVKGKGILTQSDDINFPTIRTAIGKELFNKNVSSGHCYFWLDDNNLKQVWCPKLGIILEDGTFNKVGKWSNLLKSDFSEIHETLDNEDYQYNDKFYNADTERAVFAYSKDNLGIPAYRFIGIYKFTERNGKTNIFKRVSNELKISDLIKA